MSQSIMLQSFLEIFLGGVRVKCLAHEHNTMLYVGFKPVTSCS